MELLRTVTAVSIRNRQRSLELFKSSGKHYEMTYKDIWDRFPYGYGDVDLEQLLACWISSDDSADEPKNYFRLKKSEIKYAKTSQKIYYAYELFQDLIKDRGSRENH